MPTPIRHTPSRRRAWLALTLVAPLAIAMAAATATSQPARPADAGAVAFEGARIVRNADAEPISKGTLIVRNGKVESVGPSSAAAIPEGARRVDLSGRTIIPGLINAHGHVGDTRGLASGPEYYSRENVLEQLRLYARYGVTTVYSLGGDQAAGAALRHEQTGALDRARLFIAGPVVNPRTPGDVPAQLDAVAALKADIVKIRVDDNLGTSQKMRPEVYRAVIEEAHRRGLRVAVHIFYLDDAKDVLRAGADLIAHSVRDQDVDAELVELMKVRDVCLTPTLTREVSAFVYESEPAFFHDSFFRRYADSGVLDQLRDPLRQKAVLESPAAQRYKAGLEVASRNLKALSDKGVRIALGTDSGPPGRFQGYFEHMELELMAKAGLSAREIIRAATSDAARCMRAPDGLGTLEPGAWADFLVFEASPLDDVRRMRSMEKVYVAGREVATW